VNRPLRVLRVIARLNVGGPARHVTLLDKGLRAAGFETLLAHGDVSPGEASLEGLIEQAKIPSRRIPGLGRRISPVSDLRAFAALVSLVFQVRPDIVHTHTAKAGTLGRLAAFLYNTTRPRARRCVVVHTFHGHVLTGYFGRAASVMVRGIERAQGLITDCVLVLSPRQRTDIAERFRVVDAAKVHVLPLGLELEPLAALPAPVPSPAVVFGFVGRFVPIKNLPMLIAAFADVHAQLPASRLLLVGDGDDRAAVEADVAARGLQGAVAFGGWRNDLTALYREIDVLVLTSLNEGTPVAAIEAMAAGLPVVATDVGGVADVIEHGVTGLLVPSGAVAELAAAMIRLGNSPGERARLGRGGRESVRARYSAQRLVTDVARLYRTELERKRSTI
jgi:glycosyltransferase involved in cell wall biosynthesis